jgi:DNA polymerase III alpha subunit (gram-positive type)
MACEHEWETATAEEHHCGNDHEGRRCPKCGIIQVKDYSSIPGRILTGWRDRKEIHESWNSV